MKEKETLQITDEFGFIYHVIVEHTPHHGFSIAYFNDRIIANCELGRINEPISDDDREWDRYNELLAEWKDEVNSNLFKKCTDHFNNQYITPL